VLRAVAHSQHTNDCCFGEVLRAIQQGVADGTLAAGRGRRHAGGARQGARPARGTGVHRRGRDGPGGGEKGAARSPPSTL
jgi:hypothetical protein